MTTIRPEWRGDFSPPGQIFLFSSLFFLPALSPSLFGWFNGLLAVPVFFLLVSHGPNAGKRKLRASLLLAAAGALAAGGLEIFCFALTSVPLGICLYQSAGQGDTAAASGAKGVIALGLAGLLFWILYGAVAGLNPYTELLAAIDHTLEQTLELYSSDEIGLSPEVIAGAEQFIAATRKTLPGLLPGLLAAMTTLTVWINMLFIGMLMRRFNQDLALPWGPYATWKLPDQMVWCLIAGVVTLLIGSGTVRYVGGWLVLLSVLLYFFQGLAVVVALLEHWKVPLAARVILYVVLLVQSYSLIILAVLGVSDIWFNIRPRQTEHEA